MKRENRWPGGEFLLRQGRRGRFHPRVTDTRAFLKYWLPVIAWMALIFIGSSAVGSTPNTSRIIVPFLRWLNPDVSEQTIHRVQVVVRKSGHLTEYAVLAALLWRARRRPPPGDSRPWNLSEAVWAITVATLYAVTDEIHQAFVPARLGSPGDVLIDALGATLGIGLIWAVGWRKRRWRGH